MQQGRGRGRGTRRGCGPEVRTSRTTELAASRSCILPAWDSTAKRDRHRVNWQCLAVVPYCGAAAAAAEAPKRPPLLSSRVWVSEGTPGHEGTWGHSGSHRARSSRPALRVCALVRVCAILAPSGPSPPHPQHPLRSIEPTTRFMRFSSPPTPAGRHLVGLRYWPS